MFKTVLIPVDVTVPGDTDKLLAAAQKLTEGWDCDCHVVTVIPNMGMAIVGSHFNDDFEKASHEAAERELAAAIARHAIKATTHVRVGRIYDSIISCAKELGADLIVIGAHQPELRDYLLGSNAARIVRHSGQSVMVLRDTD